MIIIIVNQKIESLEKVMIGTVVSGLVFRESVFGANRQQAESDITLELRTERRSPSKLLRRDSVKGRGLVRVCKVVWMFSTQCGWYRGLLFL